MFRRSIIKTKKAAQVEVGSLLVAQPFWQDEKYKRSVILILEHNYKGTTGIILNKQSTLSTYDTLPELEIGLPLYYGGPCNTELVSFIHNYPNIPEAVHLGNELFFGGNYEYMMAMILNKQINLRKIRFFAGFVEWNVGQLEEEIFENKWWTNELTAQEFFSASTEELWSYELINAGHIYGLFNEFPDPGFN